jgi:hypothetical protein
MQGYYQVLTYKQSSADDDILQYANLPTHIAFESRQEVGIPCLLCRYFSTQQ